ncbi:hypothetical protein NM208_g15982 [Fusarium decemcellulare]|uniref:Uncharacterized protein n=1 Tax=Fusarium decemcellulare TaxID=57161 RepID=A0ACC1RD95_9HYPO|nr:hypothetical protein NM208_g15982 [Fusarium decemcellulare]
MPLLSLTGLSSGVSQLLQETSSNLANTSTTPEVEMVVPSASSNAPASMSQTIPTRQHLESSARGLTEANLRKHEATSPPAPRGGIRGRNVNQDEDPPREWYEWYRVYHASQREARRNGGVREE